MKIVLIGTLASFLLISWKVADFAGADPYADLQDPGQRMIMGVDKCKPCHMSPKKGAQYKQWQGTQHAKAFETLGTDKAKEIAKAKGLGNPQEEMACLKCHVDGAGVDAKFLGEKYRHDEGVGCESCHGAGGDYWTKEVMQDVTDGKVDGASVGLVKPTEATCKKCHNEESPTAKAFNFAEMYEKIKHERPKDGK